MKITSVSKYKGSTYMIEFEDYETQFLNNSTIQQFNLKAGLDLPLSAWEEIKEEEEYRKAKERALYLLDYKDYSYISLFKKLEKNYSEDTCFRVLDKLTEIGCVNDRRYAAGLARHYCEVKKFGRYRAFNQMKLKGLTNDVINDALDEYSDGEYERLLELTRKRIGRYIDDERGIDKLKNALVRQGYSYSLVKEAVSEVREELEDL